MLVLFFLSMNVFAQNVVIKGRVLDDQRSPIELAQVRIEGTAQGAVCNLKGEYRFSAISSDSMVVVFSMIGYETRKRVLKNPADSVVLNVMLPHMGIELGEVEVSDIRRQTSTMTDVNLKDTKHMGNASGGSVEQIIATQSGVSTHNELSSQYNVRGGSFDENSTYINGIEVYRPQLINSGEQEGLSIINPDMVESVSFSAGGFEAKYGEKMSSVLDIRYKRVKGFEASVSASLLGASAYVGFGNEKFSVTNAIRYKTMKNLLGTLDTKGQYDPRNFDYQTYWSWKPNKRWRFDLIGIIQTNDYKFIPSDRTTKFGTQEDAKEFKVYFDGADVERYRTYFGNVSATYNFNANNELTFNLSAFRSTENQTFDIQGQYWLNNQGEEQSLAIGTYMEHGRNHLVADVVNMGFSGRTRITSHDLRYGLLLKFESVSDRMNEWNFKDSAGYSMPHSVDGLAIESQYKGSNSEKSTRLELYVQDTWRREFKEGEMVLNYGARLSYWSFNKETLFSPRATIAFTPAKAENVTIRFSTGLYYQAPFYKELNAYKVENGNTTTFLNSDIKSQMSVHFVLGAEYKFRVARRPFKLSAEAYYKVLDNLIPYNVENIKMVYMGGNYGKGYAAGLDVKLYGEFVPGTDSWISIGLMGTKEKLKMNGMQTGYLPRPTDQLFNLGLFFSDYFPSTDRWKVSLRAHYATGLPFGPDFETRTSQSFRMPDYKRVDLGISYRLLKNDDRHLRNRIGNTFRNIWLGIDAFNILGINNVVSYYWVNDVNNDSFAVPNYLTGRQINARVLFEF